MTRALLVAAALLLAPRSTDACSLAPPCAELAPAAKPAASHLADPDAAIAAQHALALAKSASVAAVTKVLRDPAWVKRIMDAPDGARCLMPPILRALAGNPAKDARTAFTSLVASKLWSEDGTDPDHFGRLTALLQATAVFRPAGPEVTALWKRLGAPEQGWAPVVTQALVETATAETAAIYEAMLRDPAYELDNRISWLHTDLLGHRNNSALLSMTIRLLDAKEPKLRDAAVESVFDYNQRWWGMCGGPPRIALADFSADARAQLRSLAASARKQKLPKPLPLAITRTMAELDKLPK